jgi:FkbM family methyltransferase
VAAPLQHRLGVWRSLAIYYGNPTRQRRMTTFYSQFIKPGSLCFDIGAHVGNRIRPWLRLGARVVALEPQPQLMPVLERLYGRYGQVTLLQQAVGAAEGTATLLASPSNPTVATLSADWIDAIRQGPGFDHLTWEPSGSVSVTTLDILIAQFGRPEYCKIDVEGYELDVLNGLSQPLPVVSFEYIPITIDRAAACIARLGQLGDYEFNWFEGETHRWQSADWLDADRFDGVLGQLAGHRRSGDIFARERSVT